MLNFRKLNISLNNLHFYLSFKFEVAFLFKVVKYYHVDADEICMLHLLENLINIK